ncbi:MAG: cytochrome b/b6 domain-containing protein [Pseudomonadales bacterium]|nr:cytochrome b/b6 domain-containing protein [Pseudomonadales bacterium]
MMTSITETTIEDSQPRVDSHSALAKVLHWGFIAVFIFALYKQIDEVEELEDFALLQFEMAYASFFLILLLARFFYMRKTRPTVLPDDTPRMMKNLAKAVHLGMYASLALIAMTGLTIGSLYWSGTKSGALLDAIILLHEIAYWTSMNLIAAHIIAAIYHRQKGDGIWDSMVPLWKENESK